MRQLPLSFGPARPALRVSTNSGNSPPTTTKRSASAAFFNDEKENQFSDRGSRPVDAHVASLDFVLAGLDELDSLIKDTDPAFAVLNNLRAGVFQRRAALSPPASTWPAPRPLAPLQLSLVPTSLDTRTYIFDTVWARFDLLHRVAPGHPLFGPPTQGLLRLPFRLPGGRGAASSWHLRVRALSDSVAKKMGNRIRPGTCWLLDSQDTSIQQRRPDGSQASLSRYKHHRLLAFLRVGSPAAWSDFLSGTDRPALHFCHNGFTAASKSGCVNGIEHVFFGSAAENNLQRLCAPRDRSQCPGHGVPPQFCIFVDHASGCVRPCLNLSGGLPVACPHVPACF
jgi:hypothetical protein